MNKSISQIVLSFVLLLGTIELAAQDRFNVTLLGRWDNPDLKVIAKQKFNDIWGWYDSTNGREYAIMGSLDSVYFFDISDPSKPLLCDVEAGKSNSSVWRDFKTWKNYCYAVADMGPSSLQIFDMKYLPDSVHKVYDSDTFLQRTHNIQLENGRLYCSSVTLKNGTRRAMQVLDLSDPENPELVNILIPPISDGKPAFNACHDVHLRNDTLYCSGENSGVFVYDYRQVNNPRLISSITNYQDQGYAHSSWTTADNDYLVMADENLGLGLKLFDVSKLPRTRFRSVFRSNPGSVPHNPFIKGVWVYVAYYEEGLWIFDISNPDTPVIAAFYDTYPDNLPGEFNGFYGCWGVYPFLPSGNIIASDMLHGLFVFKTDYGVSAAEYSIDKSTFKIYPNPATRSATIFSGTAQAAQFEILDVLGNSQLSGQLEPMRETLVDVSRLAPGAYVVSINGLFGKNSQKLIVR